MNGVDGRLRLARAEVSSSRRQQLVFFGVGTLPAGTGVERGRAALAGQTGMDSKTGVIIWQGLGWKDCGIQMEDRMKRAPPRAD